MKISITSTNIVDTKTECLLIPFLSDLKNSPTAHLINKATKGLVKDLLTSGEFDGAQGSSIIIHRPTGINAERLILIGINNKPNITDFSGAIATASINLCKTKAGSAIFAIEDILNPNVDSAEITSLTIQSIFDANYEFNQMKSVKLNQSKSLFKLKEVKFFFSDSNSKKGAKSGITKGTAISNGKALAKDLGNLPGNVCTPKYMANRARTLSRTHGLKVSIFDEKKMENLKMGSLLSVSKGSREPARFIIMEHLGGKKNEAPIVLVGKGITFDAGGISLKPAGGMDEMKYDMCGGASVFGTMMTAAELKLKLNVIGVVPCSENLPDGAANKPGDIVTSMSGMTIEILNTDAEGRLILCDAITYSERFKPAAIIDIATLTGACVVALGGPASGLFSNNDELAEELISSGELSGDKAWRLPVWQEYQKQLDSPFADIANIGGRTAGAITAACFLSRFATNMKWAHIDIAGSAWQSGGKKGATGRPVKLLTQFLINRSK